ncbi:MAG: class I adenylate cyclase [Enterovibrio sp.]
MCTLQNYVEQQLARFDIFNQARFERACSAMHAQALTIFNILPVLLHINDPAVPGFVEKAAVFGIANFPLTQVKPQVHLSWQALFDSKLTDLAASQTTPIKGLYAMGSTGSIGQNFKSDLDIWVCVEANLTRKQQTALEQKCQQISDWTLDQGVECNFFVMSEERFRSQNADEMTSDNCGTSQHYLLLDEFYRSAICLAGLPLMWYLVPPDQEDNYENYLAQLVKQGQLRREAWIDFGGLPSIPAEEFFGSSLWQLYKGIDSPYKSVLKAILLEAYSWEYPKPRLLSIEYKRRFFAEQIAICQTDSYLLVLDKVMDYLEKTGDEKRLNLVRRCFYLKTNEKLSQPVQSGKMDWRREIVSMLVTKWRWSKAQIAENDNRNGWKIYKVKQTHNELIDALMLSYRNLIAFAEKNRINSSISSEDISMLARKLYAAFEVLPGKVTLINTQFINDLHEDDLSFIQVPEGSASADGWYLYKHSLAAEQIIGRAPLEHNRYLSQLVAWAYFNELLTPSTRIHHISKGSHVDEAKSYQFASDIRNTFSITRTSASREALSSPCEIRKLALFINLEQDPTYALAQPLATKTVLTASDVFSFSCKSHCLIGSIDLIYTNSWNEVRTLHFKGDSAILEVLKAILNKMHQDAKSPESLDVFCYASQQNEVIRRSVLQLISDAIDMRLHPSEPGRQYRFKLLRVAAATFGLFFERRGVSVQKLENPIDFYRTISSNKISKLPVMQLTEVDITPPALVDSFASEGLIQFFFEDCDNGFNIYLLDEHNRIEVYRQCGQHKEAVVRAVNRFYSLLQNKDSLHENEVNFNLPQFYEIIHHASSVQLIPYKTERLPQNPDLTLREESVA